MDKPADTAQQVLKRRPGASEVPLKGDMGDLGRPIVPKEGEGSTEQGSVKIDRPSTPLEGTSEPVIEGRKKHLTNVPRKYRGLYGRAWRRSSRKAAVRAKCLECVGWLPTEVEACTSPNCPLFRYRING